VSVGVALPCAAGITPPFLPHRQLPWFPRSSSSGRVPREPAGRGVKPSTRRLEEPYGELAVVVASEQSAVHRHLDRTAGDLTIELLLETA
jgi:hypothetical protein